MKQFFLGLLAATVLVIIGMAFLNGNITISGADGQNLNNAVMSQQPQQPQQIIVVPATATPAPGGVTFTVLDDGSEPVIHDQAPTAAATAVPLPTYTPYPTYTPVKLLNDYGLPPMGPYSLEEVALCQSIIDQGNIAYMPDPQRGLCETYVAAVKDQ